ncbi:MAG: methyltransferase domain-containing protein [Acidobacteriota bacterium]|nr:methyltransferase domain-containing protein [Acidobacteriota bacterium]
MKTSDVLEANVDRLYRHRFPTELLARRAAVWQVLCEDWFARYIAADARVVEVAAGYCEFINHIPAGEKVAVDINPETNRHAASEVTVHQVAAEQLAAVLPAKYFDAAFMSNFLEHCRSRDDVLAILRATAAVLKRGGRLLILGPNFRYCYRDYFDFFDHHLPLTEKSVIEALQLAGFELEVVQPRTLPFSFRSRLPNWPWLVRLYLRLPLLWRLFGAQFFIVARAAV